MNVHTPYEAEIERTDVFIKFDEIEKNLQQLPQDKTGRIILYCKTGKMSETAAKKLAELGFTNVSHLKGGMEGWRKAGNKTFNIEELKKFVLPEGGFAAPVKWGNLGPTLLSLGVIDLEKFKKAVDPTEEQMAILTGESDQPIVIDSSNSQFIVDVLWALGLVQKSKVYTDG
ncbi:rhodanese-like domain-containing protein, partial [Candidatus Gottesmanbacteria bacterium]|nr:rhodanese-like domain-containing protein [Candidatus Gottesmanbacteria bacterium]